MVTILLILVALALLAATVWLYRRGIVAHVAGALWLLFIPYEVWFQSRCTGECNIRVDLVLILAVLLLLSIASVVWLMRRAWLRRGAKDAGRQIV